MMANVNKRLDDLEKAASSKSGYAVLYADPKKPGEYTERSPFSKDSGKRFNEAEKQELESKVNLTVIEYVRDWRPAGNITIG